MKNEEHMIMAFVIALLGGVYGQSFIEYFDFILYVFFVGLTVLGSVVPNLIEHPDGKSHRRFFHSVLVLGILIIVFLLLIVGTQSIFTYLSLGFVLGYVSHLLFDVMSPQSLPKY